MTQARSPQIIQPKSDRGLNFQRNRQTDAPDGYELYNSELIGPSHILTLGDREIILRLIHFFAERTAKCDRFV